MAFLRHTERRVARALAEAADPGDALSRALATIGASLRWPLGAVWEPDLDDPTQLRCIELWHIPGLDAQEFGRASRELTLAPGEGLPGRVWLSGEAAWVPDVQDDASFPRASVARQAGPARRVRVPAPDRTACWASSSCSTGGTREVDGRCWPRWPASARRSASRAAPPRRTGGARARPRHARCWTRARLRDRDGRTTAACWSGTPPPSARSATARPRRSDPTWPT